MAHQPCDRFEWERFVRRASMPPTEMLIALTLSTYADYDGSRIHPGTKRLIAVTGLSRATILRAISRLRDMGFIERTAERYKQGRNKGGADEYQLTIPADVTCLEVLDPTEEQVSPLLPVPLGYPQTRLMGETRSVKNGSHRNPDRVSPMRRTGLTHDTPPIQDQPEDQPPVTSVVTTSVEVPRLSTGQDLQVDVEGSRPPGMTALEAAAWRAARNGRQP